jgi:hypothetical protein
LALTRYIHNCSDCESQCSHSTHRSSLQMSQRPPTPRQGHRLRVILVRRQTTLT